MILGPCPAGMIGDDAIGVADLWRQRAGGLAKPELVDFAGPAAVAYRGKAAGPLRLTLGRGVRPGTQLSGARKGYGIQWPLVDEGAVKVHEDAVKRMS